jgi:septal ring-binding cell division protein DamX
VGARRQRIPSDVAAEPCHIIAAIAVFTRWSRRAGSDADLKKHFAIVKLVVTDSVARVCNLMIVDHRTDLIRNTLVMSLLDAGLTVRYRRFRARHEHTYPITFFLLGLGKFLLEIALLGVACVCLFMLALKVAGGKSGFIAANDSTLSVEQPVSVMTAEAESTDVLRADASFAAVSAAERVSTKALSGAQFAEQSLVRGAPVVQANITTEVVSPVSIPASENSGAADTVSGLSETKNVAVVSDIDDTLQQKVVVARSKEGADSDQIASIYDHEWVLSRPRNHYVIQLASSPRLDKLLEFSRELDDESTVAVFPFKVSSSQELLYGVAVGEYATVRQAMEAVANYPDSTKRYSPWVRRLADLQKEIKSINMQSGLQLTPASMQ